MAGIASVPKCYSRFLWSYQDSRDRSSGDSARNSGHPVTLNSFQGPFRLPPSSCRPRATLRFGAFVHSRSGYAAQWMLKRVQHDE